MNEPVQYLRVQVGKRQWLLAVVESKEPLNNPCSFLSNAPDEPDLLILTVIQSEELEQWKNSINTQCEDCRAQFIKEGLSNLNPLLSKPCLVVGPQQLLERFCNSVTPSQEAPRGSFTSGQEEIWGFREGLDLSEIPRFPEERHQDPFGQNQQFLNDTRLKVAKFAGTLAKSMHDRQLTIMLPLLVAEQTNPSKTVHHGDIDPRWTVIPLSYLPDDIGPTQLVREQVESLQQEEEGDTELDLIQRFLVTLAALPPDMLNSSDWLEVAEFLEELGYLFASSNLDMETQPEYLLVYLDLGMCISRLHTHKIIHGDLDLSGNIRYNENAPLGQRTSFIDFDAGKVLKDRSLTAWERATDLALLKLQCSFLEWEAVKLGYCFNSPNDIVEETFKLI